MFEQWTLLEGDFHGLLRVDLEDAWPAKTWRWFRTRLDWVLAHDGSLLARHFRNTDPDDE